MTRYEVVLEGPEQSYLLVYTGRKSRHALTYELRTRHHAITLFLGFEIHTWRAAGSVVDGLVCDEGWKIRFSGRTQRTAETEGELPWYRDGK